MNACLLFCHIKVLSFYKFKHAIFYSLWISIASAKKSGPQCIDFIYLVFRSYYMTSVILLIFWPCKLFSHLEFIFQCRIRSRASYSRRQLRTTVSELWQSLSCWFNSHWKDFVWSLGVSLVAQLVKNLPAMQGHRFDPGVRKIRWRREWQPTPVFLPGKSHG